MDYSKLLMKRLTFKENLCTVSNLSSPLNQISWWVPVSTRLFTKTAIIRSISRSWGPSIDFPWERYFANLDINDKVCLFNKIIKNILSNFIPHETITFHDRDSPWINSQVKHLINEKNAIYKNYLENNESNRSFSTFQSIQSQISSWIANLKNKYYSKVAKQLLDPRLVLKRVGPYWKHF